MNLVINTAEAVGEKTGLVTITSEIQEVKPTPRAFGVRGAMNLRPANTFA